MSTRLARPLLPAALLIAVLPECLHAQIYRCEKDSVTVYSDKPCAPDAKPAKLPPAVVIPAGEKADLLRDAELREQRESKAEQRADKAEVEWQQSHAAGKADAERIREARVSREVVKGMTPADVRRVLGEPTLVSNNTSGKTPRETWSYAERDNKRVHVTFTEGVVSAVRVRETKK